MKILTMSIGKYRYHGKNIIKYDFLQDYSISRAKEWVAIYDFTKS